MLRYVTFLQTPKTEGMRLHDQIELLSSLDYARSQQLLSQGIKRRIL
jgi:hypothetical protein